VAWPRAGAGSSMALESSTDGHWALSTGTPDRALLSLSPTFPGLPEYAGRIVLCDDVARVFVLATTGHFLLRACDVPTTPQALPSKQTIWNKVSSLPLVLRSSCCSRLVETLRTAQGHLLLSLCPQLKATVHCGSCVARVINERSEAAAALRKEKALSRGDLTVENHQHVSKLRAYFNGADVALKCIQRGNDNHWAGWSSLSLGVGLYVLPQVS
jgi:hypothetical protein